MKRPVSRAWLPLSTLSFLTTFACAQTASNAPPDQPRAATSQQVKDTDKALAPYIQAARQSYPSARARFHKGLPTGEHFFVVTRIFDAKGHFEQVFIRVRSITDGKIAGVISSQISLIEGFKEGQPYSFSESDLVDWVIAKPDGSEEGNVVGKFLDNFHQ
jgi:uncharacterized protein YegJ (DUF2314 family)